MHVCMCEKKLYYYFPLFFNNFIKCHYNRILINFFKEKNRIKLNVMISLSIAPEMRTMHLIHFWEMSDAASYVNRPCPAARDVLHLFFLLSSCRRITKVRYSLFHWKVTWPFLRGWDAARVCERDRCAAPHHEWPTSGLTSEKLYYLNGYRELLFKVPSGF